MIILLFWAKLVVEGIFRTCPSYSYSLESKRLGIHRVTHEGDEHTNMISVTPKQIRVAFFSDKSPLALKKMSDSYLNGYLTLYPTVDAVPYNRATFDFDACLTKTPETYQLFLQGLVTAGYLLCTYLDTSDERYINAADSFISDWLRYMSGRPTNQRTWCDHSVALRSEVLALYISVLRNRGMPVSEELSQNAQLCIENALNEETYTKNHNHGILQLRGLFSLSIVLQRDDLVPLIVERLKEQYDHAYTEYGIHVENTFEYQRFVTRLFEDFSERIFPLASTPIDTSWLQTRLKESHAFMDTVAFTPGGRFPQIGDMINRVPVVQNWESQYRFYNASPGYYVAKEKSTFKIFKAGFQSFAHKHFDDLAIYLYSHGNELLIDPGMYNYERNNVMRSYFVSARAHNTVTVDRLNLGRNPDLLDRSGFLSYQEGTQYNTVSGYNDMYEGVHIIRTLYDFGDLLTIVDQCESKMSHTYNQFWHLNENSRRISDSRDTVYTIPFTEMTLRIRQLNGSVSSDTWRGRNNADPKKPQTVWPISGWVCRKVGEATPTDTVMFSQTGKAITFVTVISVENAGVIHYKDDSMGTIDDIQINRTTHTLEFKGERISEIPAATLLEFNASFVEIFECNGTSLTLKNTFTCELYCFQIIDSVNGETVLLTKYSPHSFTEWTPVADGNYKIKAYVRNGMDRKSALVAHVKVTNGKVSLQD